MKQLKRWKSLKEKISYTAYRFSKGSVGTKGQAGTFYTLQPQNRGEKVFTLSFNKVLIISQDDAEAFEGLPAESVLYKYKDARIYEEVFSQIASNLESSEIIDIAVAMCAKNKKYEAIQYGNLELQDLTTITKQQLLLNLFK